MKKKQQTPNKQELNMLYCCFLFEVILDRWYVTESEKNLYRLQFIKVQKEFEHKLDQLTKK